MARLLFVLVASFGGVVLFANFAGADEGAAKPQAARGSLSPQQALAEFKIAPGLKLELVAAEPEIESPVAMAFDEDGKLWVVEMRDYPNGPAPGAPPEGRIKVLEDRDGDGRYEHSRIFADKLLFANGLLPWKGGVIVTAAPHILYLRDTDGDGTADQREVLYEGFAALNPQLRVSHPILGLDGWIYVANGLRGGQVIRSGKPDAKPINLGGMDFRFDMIHDRAEAISGMGQYGNTFDDWGNRFVCDNNHHIRHVVLPSRYIQRNPFLAVPQVLEDISEINESVSGAGAKLYPLSKNWTTSNLHAGRFTAACGVFIYRGDLLPEEYRGAAFTCDPTGNLVHAETMKPHGATFRSRPLREGVEFLATPDEWTRPVSLAHGPDGALYLVDMARAVIEHPEFVPAELKNRPDLLLGKDKGRIWRIVPEKDRIKISDAEVQQRRQLRLSVLSSGELINMLHHPNGWNRTTAYRLLLEGRFDHADFRQLRASAHGGSVRPTSFVPLAAGKLYALSLVETFDGLELPGDGVPALLPELLRDSNPRIREFAVVVAERLVANPRAVRGLINDLATDRDPRVRFQVALTLGEWNDDAILQPLAKIALAGLDDRWTRIAVASAVPNRAGALIATLLQPPYNLAGETTPDRLRLLQELAALVGARQDAGEVTRTLNALRAIPGKTALTWEMAGLNGLAAGMERRGKQLGVFVRSLERGETASDGGGVLKWFDALLAQAAGTAGDRERELNDRLEALRLLAHASWQVAEPALARLLTDEPAQEVRLATVRALAAHPQPAVPTLLMKSWKGYTPPLRREVIEAMLRQPERIAVFLDEVEAGRVKPGDVDTLRTQQLLKHGKDDIRERAKKLLSANLPPERKLVLEAYQAALAVKGDAIRGRAAFQKNCATCHRVGGIGVDVGADIADTRTKTPESLLTNILNPNQAIDSNYINYVVLTKGGKVLTGVIAAETASSITLKRAENQTEVVLRQEIEDLESTGVSLMPEGLEKNIPVPDMADLLSFLKNWRYLDGAVPPGISSP